jgi:N-methylhydantoinase A/oxoprolinase/acetone carboxylase beta subunit
MVRTRLRNLIDLACAFQPSFHGAYSEMASSGNRTLGLGIDTGGTFTDAAIIDMETMEILTKAKSPTTYQNLSVGLLGAVDGVIASGKFTVDEIKIVGLSTTLATNSILTGKGGQVGLICIGWSPDRDWDMGTKVIESVEGGHTVRGYENQPLDVAALDRAINSMAHKVDAIAISSIFSVYNPDHEERARKAILEKVNMLTVTGHDLTTELGIKERTITAVLNAKLIPIIGDFLSSVEHSMEKRGIKGQIMVYKGDGSLMNIAVARGRPVDTILSGPAASLMGGRLLSKLENCIVLDIGGTSTDIAYLDRGFPRINREGASVGNWRTRVRAIDIWTSGLGGDSDMQVDRFGHLEIGPERVMPLAIASKMNPSVLDKLRLTRQTTYYMAYDRDTSKLSHEDRVVYNFLRESQVCTLNEANEALPELTFVTENLRSLKAKGFVVQTGVTPTDVMHVKGVYTPGDVLAAREGVEIFSNLSGMTVDQFTENFMDTMVTMIVGEVIKKIISDEAGDIVPSRALDYLIKATLGAAGFRTMSIQASLDRPIVGIGAPAHVFVPELEKRMNVKVIIPPNHDVGNAVGAVCSKVSEFINLQVYPRDFKFWIFSPFAEPIDFHHQEEAVEKAKEMASEHVRAKAVAAGAKNVEVMVDVDEKRFSPGSTTSVPTTNWIEVRARATGDPL